MTSGINDYPLAIQRRQYHGPWQSNDDNGTNDAMRDAITMVTIAIHW
jgi:hypothetical protein